jgi:hypothetical protein
MHTKTAGRSATLRGVLFFIVLAVVAGWAAWSVVVLGRQMRPADTPAVAFRALPSGQSAKAVVFLSRVDHGKLSGTLLQPESDTVYRRPAEATQVDAEMTPDTAVVMGVPQDIAPGAVVQLAGTLDGRHVLQTRQIVILTRDVRVERQ